MASSYDPVVSNDTFTNISYKWLASRHGLSNSKTYLIDAAAFPEATFENGRVRAGQTLALNDAGDKVIPYAEGRKFLGCLSYDCSVRMGDDFVPVLLKGIVNKEFLPETAVVPADSAHILFR